MNNPFFDRPILNSPYQYPGRHWELDADGQPTQQIIESRLKMWATGDVQGLAAQLIRLGMCWPLSLVRMLEIERQVRTATMKKLRNRRRAQKQAWERRTRHERALRRKAVRFENTIKHRVKLFAQWGPGGFLS
jgi:hypothetical protein